MSDTNKIRLLQLAPVPNTAGMSSSQVAAAYKQWENKNAELHFDWLKSHIPEQKQQPKVISDDEPRRQAQPVHPSGQPLKRFNSWRGSGSSIQEQIDMLRGQLSSSLEVLNAERKLTDFKMQKVNDAMPEWKRKYAEIAHSAKPSQKQNSKPKMGYQ